MGVNCRLYGLLRNNSIVFKIPLKPVNCVFLCLLVTKRKIKHRSTISTTLATISPQINEDIKDHDIWSWKSRSCFRTGRQCVGLCRAFCIIFLFSKIIVWIYIYTQRKKLSTPMFFLNDKWYKHHEITDRITSRTQWWHVRTLHWL
jgi:hypothetical protein